MVLKNFRLNVIWRTLVIAVALAGAIYFFVLNQLILAGLLLVVVIIQLYNLIHYVESTNRKVTFFLESIDNSDFTVKFSRDDRYGKPFRELNEAFNRVLEAFREVRAQKEENLQYLNTVVQYVRVGLISFDETGKIQLLNNAAIKLLRTPYIRNIKELGNPELIRILGKIQPGSNTLFNYPHDQEEQQLSITSTELRLRGKPFKLVSLHNIQPELQQKEIEAWQNLAKVLRHEIMNSITPITSHVETLNEMLEEELAENDHQYTISQTTVEDISKALSTIEKRSKGLMNFVNAYRNFSDIPQPNLSVIRVDHLLERLVRLFTIEMEKAGVDFNWKVSPNNLYITADSELIETVLINLLKNAIEASRDMPSPKVFLKGGLNAQSKVYISVTDNGPGIIPEALEKIFVPFYTTKKQGSGIGLSLSRQIMHLHRGTIRVSSDIDNHQTIFLLQF